MKKRFASIITPLTCFFMAALVTPLVTSGEDSYGVVDGFSEGRWRTEVGVSTGFHSGNRSRTGDMLVTGNVEYEWPVVARCTLGLRAYPLFLYHQNDPSDTLWGGGIGTVGRVYQNAVERNGWFGEAGAGVIWHTNHIEGNSATMDFLLEAGVGYQFKNNWHVTLQASHLSNAGLSDNNAGANSLGVA
ncbi:MAG: acyloxyacyl hydrolase, partial [Candidatus Hydrogenedentes bacterium]|nr:acyloxyacyl hydrolase [Candidatus Hydrogenedentota bacterium]